MDLTLIEVQQALQELFSRSSLRGIQWHRHPACGPGPQVCGVTLLGSGFETDVFAFSLSSQGEEEMDLILRVYEGEGAAEKAAHEFAVMERLHDAGYPLPRVMLLERASAALGRPFVVMERVHGTSLGKSYWSSSESRHREAEALLYPLMAQLHALPASAVLPEDPLSASRDPHAFIDREFAALHDLLSRLAGQEPPSLRATLDWLGDRRAAVPCDRIVVIHRDFHPNNILVRGDGTASIIDWSNATPGDRRADLAWTRLILRADDEPDHGASSLRLYEHAAGVDVAQLEYFEASACARLLLSVLISLRHGAARQGMRPDAEALMRRDDGHLRYAVALLQERMGTAMPDLEDALAALFAAAPSGTGILPVAPAASSTGTR